MFSFNNSAVKNSASHVSVVVEEGSMTGGVILDDGSVPETFAGHADGATYGPTSYETALSGGKHSGFLKNYIDRNANEINKAINSMQTGKQGINIHLDKISNPTKYVPNWTTLRPGHQQNLLSGWQNTVIKHTEQIQILRTILGN